MSTLTSQQVRARNWMTCPRCDGGKNFTTRDIKAGAVCTYCDGKGEVERTPRVTNVWFGHSMKEG
jgi:DnaJ-class molecular chaperone